MFYSDKKRSEALHFTQQTWLVSGSLGERSAPRIVSGEFKKVVKSGEAPVYPDCLTAEQWEKSAETRRCRMRPVCTKQPDWRFFGQAQEALLTVWFSPRSERSPPAPRSRTSLRWRWLWLHLQRRSRQGRHPHGCLQISQRRRWKSEISGRNRLLVWEDSGCVLTRGELLPRLCNRLKEINDWDCRIPLSTLE